MKKGFTLIEILFVLLVIALIISFALPAYRTVRFDVKNSRAEAALRKLAEARRSFYQSTKGVNIQTGFFTGTDAAGYTSGTCTTAISSGIPGTSVSAVAPSQLFYCGYLDRKDFAGLPYKFVICPLAGSTGKPCVKKDGDTSTERIYAGAMAVSVAEAGKKYNPEGEDAYYMYIGSDMQIRDNLE